MTECVHLDLMHTFIVLPLYALLCANAADRWLKMLRFVLVRNGQLAPVIQPLETVTILGFSQLSTTKTVCVLWVDYAQ